MKKNKKELKIEKSKYSEDYNVYLHNQTEHGEGWRRLFQGSRKACLLFKQNLIDAKKL